MYLLQLHINNASQNNDSEIVLGDFITDAIPKWHLLTLNKKNHELLQLIALIFCGPKYLDYLPCALDDYFKCPDQSLIIKFVYAVHQHREKLSNISSTILRNGFQISPDFKGSYTHKKNLTGFYDQLEKRNLFYSTGNIPYFFLAYGNHLEHHTGTDNFDFIDPNFRITRFYSLFDKNAKLTDPTEYLKRLHYRAILKNRYPAKQALEQLTTYISTLLNIDTSCWMNKECNFDRQWSRFPDYQKQLLHPVIDASRHIIDASPFVADAFNIPGILLFHSPYTLCPPNMFSSWMKLWDALFPNMQMIVTLSPQAMTKVPDSIVSKRLKLPSVSISKKKSKAPIILPKKSILLIDVDSRLPNLALMKLSNYYKSKGWSVVKVRPELKTKHAEKIFASVIFNKSLNKINRLNNYYGDRLTTGGSGVSITKRLPKTIENLQPDYSLYPELEDRAIGFLTRGCPKKCEFCIVPVKEGKTHQVSDLDDLLQNRSKVILLDDNILSYPNADQLFEEMVQKNISVNFTQSLDLMLITKERAKMLRRIKCHNTKFTRNNYYFSLNNTDHLNLLRRNYGYFQFKPGENVEFIYMYGYNTTFQEDIDRLKFIKSLPAAYVFTQEYKSCLNGPQPKLSNFFDHDADRLIDELISINFSQNMKSMENYYRWISQKYVHQFKKIHHPLVDTIFRYNYRDKKGQYIQKCLEMF
ncbi:radical SAM domain protein [Candidatus Magnetomorum sp. HK-1]|nr:radical SAM domain protein [Candidatus Magnetomorum sp. HK-1]